MGQKTSTRCSEHRSMVSQSPLLMEIPDLVPAHDYQTNISITKGITCESQALHLPFSLQNNNINETSHQHSRKRKEAERMPQTLVLPAGRGPTPCWTSINNPSFKGSLEVSNMLSTSHADTLHAARPQQAQG